MEEEEEEEEADSIQGCSSRRLGKTVFFGYPEPLKDTMSPSTQER